MKLSINSKLTALLAVSALAMTGCQDEDFGYEAKDIAYEKDFMKTFGNIDPDHTWSMASRCNLSITTADVLKSGGTYTLKVYTADPRSGQQAYTLADIKVKADETVNFSVDYPFAQNYLAVALINEAGARVIRTVTIEDGKAKLDFNESSAAKAATRAGGYASVKTVDTSFGYDNITSTLDGFGAITGEVSGAQIFLATGKNYTFFSKEDLEAYENICPESNNVTPVVNKYADIVNSGRVTSFSFRPVDASTDIVISPVYHYTSSNDHLEFRLTNIATGESTEWVDLTPSGFNGTHEFHQTGSLSDYYYFYDNRSDNVDDKGTWNAMLRQSQLTTDMKTDMHYYSGASIRSHSWVLRGLPNTYVINFRLNQDGGGTLYSYSEHMMNPFIIAGSDADQVKVLPNAESFYTINTEGQKGYYEQRASLVTVNDAVAYIGFEDAMSASNIMPSEYDINDIVVQISGVETVDYSNVKNKSAEFLIACEDLGSNHDWDFNDVVFSVSPLTHGTSQDIHTDISFKLLASGGTLPLRVVYEPQDGHTAYSKTGLGDFTTISGSQNIFAYSGSASSDADPDTHDVFGVARTKPVNVNAPDGSNGKAPVASAVTIRDDHFTVANPAELKIKVWYTSDDATPGNYIPVKSEIGKVPSAFIVGNANWRWNDECVSMADDDDFKNWATNHSTIGENWYAYKKGSIVINTVEGIDDVSKESFPTYAKIAATEFTDEMKTNGCVVQFSVSTTLSHVMKYSSVTLCRYPNDYEALDIPVLLDLDASNAQTGKHGATLYDYTLGSKTTYKVELSAADVQRITESGTSEGGLMLVGSLVNINTCSVMTYEAAGLASEKAPYSSEFGLWKSISASADLSACQVSNGVSPYTTGTNVSFDGKNYKLLSADVFYPYAHADATDGVNILLHMTGGNSSSKVSMIARDTDGEWQKVIETEAPTAEGYASIHLNNRFIAETFANPVTNNMSGIAFNFTGSSTAAVDAIYVTTDAIAGVEGLNDIASKTTPEPTGEGWTELTINHTGGSSNVEFTLADVPSMYFGGEIYVSTSGAFGDSNGSNMCNTWGYGCDQSSTTFMHWTLTGAQLDGKTVYNFYKAAQLVDGSGETEIFRAWVRPSAGPDMSAAGTQVLANDETGTKRTESGNIDLSAYTSNGAIVTVVFTRTNNGYYSAGNSSSSNLYVNNKSGINASGNWVTETFEVSADQLTADNILKITAGNMNIHSVYAAAITEDVLIAQEKAKFNTNTVITETQTPSSVTITSDQIGETGAKIYVVYSGSGSISASYADPTSVTVSGVGSATLDATANSEVVLTPADGAKIEAVYIKQKVGAKELASDEMSALLQNYTKVNNDLFEEGSSSIIMQFTTTGDAKFYLDNGGGWGCAVDWTNSSADSGSFSNDNNFVKISGASVVNIKLTAAAVSAALNGTLYFRNEGGNTNNVTGIKIYCE